MIFYFILYFQADTDCLIYKIIICVLKQMKFIQRMAKIMPAIILPTLYTYNHIWTMHEDPLKQHTTQDILKSEINNVQTITYESQEIKHQKKQQQLKEKEQENKELDKQPINQEESKQQKQKGQIAEVNKEQTQRKDGLNEEIKNIEQQTSVVKQVQLQPIQPQIKQVNTNELLSQLSPNEAIVSQCCPQNIKHYLTALNFKITLTKQAQQTLTINNRRNETKTFNIKDIVSQVKDEMQLISNFISPPQQIFTIADINDKLNHISKDQFLIYTYIPLKTDYQAEMSSQTNSYSTFKEARKANLEQLESKFVNYAYNSSSNKNTYMILRTKEASDYLKANQHNIGSPYILNKTSKQSGNQSNTERLGQRLKIQAINKAELSSSDRQYFNRKTHLYINKIDTQGEMVNKIRQMQMSGDRRKVLLIYSREQKEQFHGQVQRILEQLSRIERQHVIVVKTNNASLLKNVFKVQADKFTTIRLFDLHAKQPPLFASSHPLSNSEQVMFKRSKYRGPFKLDHLCQFVKRNDLPQHYQSKNLSSLKTALPQELKYLDNTLLLLHKDRCKGCEYMHETLDQLKRIIKRMRGNDKLAKHLIYQYRIEDPKSLQATKIRRYNIFTEDANFMPPKVTPQLYYIKNGKFIDLKAASILSIIHQRKGNEKGPNVHDDILGEIINKIRLSQKNDEFQQFG